MEKRVKELKRAALLSSQAEPQVGSLECCNAYSDSTGPLHAAAMSDNFKVAKQLVDGGLSATAVSPQGTTPLHVAARHNSETVADLLIKSGAERITLDASARSPLMVAAELGHSSLVELLLLKDPACSVNMELRDSTGNTALHLAAAGDHAEVVHQLSIWKANLLALNDIGESALDVAKRCGARRVIEILVPRMQHLQEQQPPDKPEGPTSALVLSVLQNRIGDLLKADMGLLTGKTVDGKTLLHWAGIRDSADCAEYLLTTGLEVDSPDRTGASPLHYAALNGAEKCCVRFIEARADVNRQEVTGGLTPLMMAIDSEAVAAVRLLLATGRLKLDIVDRDGETALMHAAKRGNEELARMLVHEAKGDTRLLTRKNSSGLSAIEISDLLGHRKVSELLERFRPSLDVYPRRSPKSGYCLVLNQEYNSPNDKHKADMIRMRKGSEYDVKRIFGLFQGKLGFRVHVRQDLSSENMIAEVRKIVNSGVLASVDYFVCFILAHGLGNAVLCTDGKLVEIRDIALQVDAENCPDLAGKPKIFFIQACRNRENNGPQIYQVSTDDGTSKPPLNVAVAKHIDYFFGFSTWEDCYAYRSQSRGSLYIEKMYDVIEENYEKMDLLKMMTRVCREVGSTPVPGKGSTCYMVPEIKSSLQKDVKF